MRLVSVAGDRAAILLDDWVFCIPDARHAVPELHDVPSTVLGIIQTQGTALDKLRRAIPKLSEDDLRRSLEKSGALRPLAESELVAPLPCPRVIVGFGMNYSDHLAEMKMARPSDPPYLHKACSAVIGPGQPIILPPDNADMVDWEAELAVIIGRTCYRVSPDEALDYAFGYTAANDVSARDWVDESFAAQGLLDTITKWGLNLLGKQFPTFCPLGPVLVTSDELGDVGKLDVTCRVNGTVMQSSNTANMVFSTAELISYMSNFQQLEPGDVILTGTMGGVGVGRSPRLFLKSGDLVEVEIEKIGILSNPVA